MKTNRELIPLIRLALPLIVVNLGHQMMGLVDTALAGRVSTLALAAAGLGNTVFFFGAIWGMGLVMGVDPIASQAFGAEKTRHARRSMWHGIYIGVVASLPVAFLVFLLAESMELIGIDRLLAEETRLYMYARLPSMLPLFVVVAQRAYLQAAHRVAPIVISTIGVNVFNFIADWILIFGEPRLGIEPLGVEGIGWATSMSMALHVLVLAFFIRPMPKGDGDEPIRQVDRKMLRQIVRVGLPISFQLLTEVGIFTLVGVLAARMGGTQVAAHQVALMLAAFTFMVPLAIGTATSVQVGRAIGRGDTAGTREAGIAGIILGGGFMFLTASSFWLIPEPLARLVTDQSAVIPLAIDLLIIAGFFQIFDGIQAVGSGALRGAGLTRFAMVANIIAYWVVGFPVATALGLGWDLGPHGLWWGLTAGLAVAAAILTVKFLIVSRRPIKAIDHG